MPQPPEAPTARRTPRFSWPGRASPRCRQEMASRPRSPSGSIPRNSVSELPCSSTPISASSRAAQAFGSSGRGRQHFSLPYSCRSRRSIRAGPNGSTSCRGAQAGRRSGSGCVPGASGRSRGKALRGARIYFGYYWETHDEKPAALRATSDPDGHFRFLVEKSLFYHIQNRDLEPWNEARLLAVASGFGLGLSDSKQPDASHDVTLKLVPDEVPITGRLVDLEGRPVVGAFVGVSSISASPSGSLEAWIDGARLGREVSYQLEQMHLPVDVYLGESPSPIPPARTDQGGRFRIEGLGRDRIAGLIIKGDSVRQARLKVMTRRGDAIRARSNDSRPNPSFETYQPAQFQLSVAPGRVIVGTVRGKDNGESIKHAHIAGIHRLGSVDLFMRTKTDDAGHFRLVGMPIEDGTEIFAFPEDEPYFGKLVKTKGGAGKEPLILELEVARGIWAEGKVTDKVTGHPVQGAVRYAAAADNPHIDEVSGYRELSRVEGPYATSRELKKDGTFRVPVLPGRGVVIVSEAGPHYPGLSRTEYQTFRSTPYLPAYGPVQAYKTVTVSEDSQPIHLDFALDQGKTLGGTVLDQEGRPVTGVEIFGTLPEGGWTRLTKAEAFTVHGLRPGTGRSLSKLLESRSPEGIAAFVQPESPRTLVFLQPERHLAASVAVHASDPEPLSVRLQPAATVTGRLLTPDGQPYSDVEFQVYYLGFDLLDDYVYLPQFVRKTDQEGRFRIECLCPA